MGKYTGFILTIICTVLLLAACSSDNQRNSSENKSKSDDDAVKINKEGFPIVDEEITLSMMAPGTGLTEWKDMPTLQEYTEMTNVNFDYDTPPVNDFQTNLNLAFASGEVADIIFGAGTDRLTPSMEVEYGEQGMLLPLENLIEEYAPNIKRLLDERPDVKKSITTIDGHIYALPAVDETFISSWHQGKLWYNGKWLEALDIKELPKTTDEFYELLKRFRDEDPNGNGEADEIPLLDIKMNGARPWLLSAFGITEWGIEETDGVVSYTPITDAYKSYLEYANKLYDEKLLDPEVFSQADDEKKAKGQSNRSGIFPDWFSFFTSGETQEEALNNPMFYPLTSSINDDIIVPRSTGISRGAFALSSENPHPEASIRWVDYFYSQEGWKFINLGPEGYLWEEKDGEIHELDLPEGFDTSEEYRGTLTPDYGITTPAYRTPIEGKPLSDFDSFIKMETEDKIEPFAKVPYPHVYLTAEEQKESNTIEVDLQSYVEQMEAKFITGVEPLSNWDDYVKTIEDMQVDRYIEIYQTAYDRWKES